MNYLFPPGDWVPNDFKVGDRIVTSHRLVGKVTANNGIHYEQLRLDVEWDIITQRAPYVYPNLEWINYEDVNT